MNSTIVNWRESKKLYKFIGCKGIIISLTKINNPDRSLNSSNQLFIALAKINNNYNLTLPLVNESINPKIKNKVVIVLRRVKTPTKSEIIEYGLKFKKVI